MKNQFFRLVLLFVIIVIPNVLRAQCPPPSCPIGACYCIGDNTVTDERGTLYDDGGANNDYLDGATTGTQVNSYLFQIQPASNPDTIALEFKSFAMEPSATCEYDHIEILDGTISKGIFCGDDNPGVVICTSGSATIRWMSDPNTVAAGFEMFWFTDSVPPTSNGPTTPTGYCSATTSDCGNGMGIYDVDMEGDNGGFVNQTSLADCQNANGYNDYSASHIAYTSIGNAYTLEVMSNSNGYFFGQIFVFIDWNSDFDFDDPGELVYGGSSFTAGDVVGQTIVITPPAGTSTGVKRMRLRSCSCTNPMAPCGVYGLGEVEDYSIVVGDPVFCATAPVPADAATDQCQKELELSWSSDVAGASPDGYKISIGSNNPPSDIIADFDNGSDTTYTISTELAANTTYYWKVVPYNADGDAEACAIWSFTTSANGDPQVEVVHARNSVDEVFSCVDGQDVLFASAFGGAPGYTYAWSGDDESLLSSLNKDSTTFSGTQVEMFKYFVRVEDQNACYGIDSVTVHAVEGAEAGAVSGELTLCNNDMLSLSTDAFVGDLKWQKQSIGSSWLDIAEETEGDYESNLFADGDKYRLIANTAYCTDTSNIVEITVHPLSAAPGISTNTGVTSFCPGDEILLISDVENDVEWNDGSTNDTLTINAGGVYSVFYTDANSCPSGLGTITISENDLPEVPVIEEANGEDTLNFCVNAVTELSTTASGIVAWNGDVAVTSDKITPEENGKYYVTVTNAEGCLRTSDTLVVMINENPEKPTVNSASTDNSFCSGQSLELSSDATGSVYWNGDKAVSSATLTVSTGGEYFVTAVNEFDCEANSDPITVTENPSPVKPVVISVDGNEAFCEGDSLELTATSNEDYFWNGDEAVASTNIYANEAGDYFVTARNSFGCENSSEMFSVAENPLPEQPVVTRVNGDLVSSVSTGDFQWYNSNDEEVAGETNSTYSNAPDGTFYVVVSDPETGCSNQSGLFTGIIENNLANDGRFKIFPNPVNAGDILKVQSKEQIERISIVSTLGQELRIASGAEINTSELASGTYMVLISVDGVKLSIGKITVK